MIDGRFAIRSGFVRIEADRSPIEDTAVEVEFILDVIVLDEATMCGQVTDPDSVTFLPIVLELWHTFGAEAYDATGRRPQASRCAALRRAGSRGRGWRRG